MKLTFRQRGNYCPCRRRSRFSPRHIGTVSSPLPNDTSVSGIWRSARVRELHTTYLCSRKKSKISTIRAYSY